MQEDILVCTSKVSRHRLDTIVWIRFVKWINNIIFLNITGKYFWTSPTPSLVTNICISEGLVNCYSFKKIKELWEWKYVYIYKVPFEFFTEFSTECSKILYGFCLDILYEFLLRTQKELILVSFQSHTIPQKLRYIWWILSMSSQNVFVQSEFAEI